MEALRLRGSRFDDFPSAGEILRSKVWEDLAAARHRHVYFAGGFDARGLGCIFFLRGGPVCLLAVITVCTLAKKKIEFRKKKAVAGGRAPEHTNRHD